MTSTERTARGAAALTLLSAIALTGCSKSTAPSPSVVASATQAATTTSTVSAAPASPEQIFASVLANPAAIAVNQAAQYTPKGEFGYVFTDFTGDGLKDMLLLVVSQEFAPVVPIRANADGTYTAADAVLIDGAAGAGGGRARVLATTNGDGLYQVDYHSIQPSMDATKFRFVGATLEAGEKTSYSRGEVLSDAKDLVWLNTATGQDLWPHQEQRAINPFMDLPAGAAATTASQDVALDLKGTVQLLTNEEVMEGMPTPNGEDRQEAHWYLVLDQPTVITASHLNTTSTDTAKIILLDNIAGPQGGWSALSGKSVVIHSSQNGVWWPSDASIPLGQPRLGKFQSVS